MEYRKFKESATVAATASAKKSTYSSYQIFMKILLSMSTDILYFKLLLYTS